MKLNQFSTLGVLGVALGAAACGPSGDFRSQDPAARSNEMTILNVSNGFGRLLPHVIFEPLANGAPSQQPMEIRSIDDLIAAQPSDLNPILPPATWRTRVNEGTGEIEPLNVAGNLANHFIAVEFTRSLNISTVLASGAGASVNSGLTGAVTFVAVDQVTGETETLQGRAFVNGATYSGSPAEFQQ